jgi:hypothetical protein
MLADIDSRPHGMAVHASTVYTCPMHPEIRADRPAEP